MKYLLFVEILKRMSTKANFKRKLKIFAVVGIFGFFITAGLLMWTGASVVRYASQQIQSLNMQSQFENLDIKVISIPAVTTANCWDKARSLISIEPWMTKPLEDNLSNLKVACLDFQKPICVGPACEEVKRQTITPDKDQTI